MFFSIFKKRRYLICQTKRNKKIRILALLGLHLIFYYSKSLNCTILLNSNKIGAFLSFYNLYLRFLCILDNRVLCILNILFYGSFVTLNIHLQLSRNQRNRHLQLERDQVTGLGLTYQPLLLILLQVERPPFSQSAPLFLRKRLTL